MTSALEASFAWCKALTKRTAGNFYFSFLTLPADQLRDMCVLYAFMRVTDDLGDNEDQSSEARETALVAWRTELESALSEEQANHHLFPALVDLVNRHRIPPEYLIAVIEGVQTDLNPQGFETFADLENYCYHVAGAVGLCCIHVWGFEGEEAIPLAIDCGTAFQLTNILRDLGEDAAMGRVYLPREDLERFDYHSADIAAHCRDERFDELMQFEIARAREYYTKAARLLPLLKSTGKPIFAAMLRIYGGLLDEIERRQYDIYSQRVRLPRWKKLWISFDAIVRYRWLGRTASW
ncbi:MAG: phytoene/squalene synthase family protein [Planctomycetaceae bacterium]|nr:phytoene/squalene synthase family protein [Planctomycetaceae bacterium]